MMIDSLVGSRAGLKVPTQKMLSDREQTIFTTLTMNISAEHPLQQRSIWHIKRGHQSATICQHSQCIRRGWSRQTLLALWKVPFFADFCHMCRWPKSYHGTKVSTQHGTLGGHTMFYQSASEKSKKIQWLLCNRPQKIAIVNIFPRWTTNESILFSCARQNTFFRITNFEDQ